MFGLFHSYRFKRQALLSQKIPMTPCSDQKACSSLPLDEWASSSMRRTRTSLWLWRNSRETWLPWFLELAAPVIRGMDLQYVYLDLYLNVGLGSAPRRHRVGPVMQIPLRLDSSMEISSSNSLPSSNLLKSLDGSWKAEAHLKGWRCRNQRYLAF